MKLKQLFTDDDAVSPVIGVILMVAITVILAAVIATFVLGLGEQVSDTTPNANFQTDTPDNSFTVNADGGSADDGEIAEFRHTSGPALDSDNLDIRGLSADDVQEEIDDALEPEISGYTRDDDVQVTNFEVVFSDEEETSASDTVSLDITIDAGDFGAEANDDVTVSILGGESVDITWSSGGDSAILSTHEVSEIELTVENAND